MLPLQLGAVDRPLRVLAIGAHPDDIEIGAGGTLLALDGPQAEVHYVVLTGTPVRHAEARAAAEAFLPQAQVTMELHSLREGRLPALWGEVKEILECVAHRITPDLVLAPSADDAHQDHRTIGGIIRSVFRDSLYLAYEIAKWDGDLGHPSLYVPLTPDQAMRKVELLHKVYPSQHSRDWWDEEVFLGLARLRGVECHARYAEAFTSTKAVLVPSTPWGPDLRSKQR